MTVKSIVPWPEQICEKDSTAFQNQSTKSSKRSNYSRKSSKYSPLTQGKKTEADHSSSPNFFPQAQSSMNIQTSNIKQNHFENLQNVKRTNMDQAQESMVASLAQRKLRSQTFLKIIEGKRRRTINDQFNSINEEDDDPYADF